MQLSDMQLNGLTCTLYVVSWSTIHFLGVDYSSYCTPANVGALPGRAQHGYPTSQASAVRETSAS